MSYLSPSTPLVFGADNIAGGADTRFLPPGFTDGTAPTVDEAAITIGSRPISVFEITVRHNLANGNGASVDYDLLVSGIPAGIGLSLATAAVGQTSIILPTPIVFPAGSTLSVTATKPIAVGSGNIDCVVMFIPQ